MSRQLLTFRERSEESRQPERSSKKTDISIIMNGVTLNGGDISVVLVHGIKYVWLSLGVLVNKSKIFIYFFLVGGGVGLIYSLQIIQK